MKIVFMGSPGFAVTVLRELVASQHEVAAVITNPDAPAGRGKQTSPTPVKVLAAKNGLPVLTPENLFDPGFLRQLASFHADAAVVAAYGKKLPTALLELFPLGCLNVHGSLLPAYRGASPIASALRGGQLTTGVTIMFMAEGLDEGDICLQEETAIEPEETCGELCDRLGKLGGRLAVQALDLLADNKLTRTPQSPQLATYCGKIKREHEKIDWRLDGAVICNLIRSLSPQPGASACLGEETIKLTLATFESGSVEHEIGRIYAMDKKRGLAVAVHGGILWVLRVKPAGKREMSACDWYRGRRDREDLCFS